MKRIIFTCCLFAALVPLLHCSGTTLTGNGGSSETVNAKLIISDTSVNVTVDNSDRRTLSMQIFSTNYHPFEQRGFADSVAPSKAIDVRWQAPTEGTFNILLTEPARHTACFVRNLSLRRGAADTVECIFAPVNVLAGCIVRSARATGAEPYLVAIDGSPFYSLSDTTCGFRISAVPPGDYSMSVRSTAKRLFVASSSYSITSDMFDQSTRLRVIIP